MKTCLGVIAAISIIAGLFVLVPLIFIKIPDWRTARSGEMVLTRLETVILSSGSNSHVVGYIKGDGRKAIFGDEDQLRDYLGHTRLSDTLESGVSPVVPVWYTDRGVAISRFDGNKNPPDFYKVVFRALRNTSLLFLPALLIFIYYGYQRWKHAAYLGLLLGYGLLEGSEGLFIHLNGVWV